MPILLGRPRSAARCGSSVVEHPLGKGEVESSILSRSTSPAAAPAMQSHTDLGTRLRALRDTVRRKARQQHAPRASARSRPRTDVFWPIFVHELVDMFVPFLGVEDI